MIISRKTRRHYRTNCTPERLAKLFRQAERHELTPRAVRSRTRAADAYQAQVDAVTAWEDDDLAYRQGRLSKTAYKRRWRIDPDTSEWPPVYMPQGRDPRQDLYAHQWALEFQALYWTLPASKRLIRKARRSVC
ncbi:MAG: hypothetical protein ACPGSE_00285 [Synechococcus sp.]